MIYGDYPNFEEIIKALRELEKEINDKNFWNILKEEKRQKW